MDYQTMVNDFTDADGDAIMSNGFNNTTNSRPNPDHPHHPLPQHYRQPWTTPLWAASNTRTNDLDPDARYWRPTISLTLPYVSLFGPTDRSQQAQFDHPMQFTERPHRGPFGQLLNTRPPQNLNRPATPLHPDLNLRLRLLNEGPRRTRMPDSPRPPKPKQLCTACMDEFTEGQLYHMTQCGCKYCKSCLNQAFTSGCTDLQSFPPKCCGEPLRISVWGNVIEKHVLTRYKAVEQEFSSQKPLYCCVPKCSTFIPESSVLNAEEVGVCPTCTICTCMRCKRDMREHDVWPVAERVCPAVDKNTAALQELSTEKKWKQCPSCSAMIERIDGCNHMDCVCGVEFCYRCGAHFDEEDTCECDESVFLEDEEDDESDEDGEGDGEHEDEEEEEEDDDDDDDDDNEDDEEDDEAWPDFINALDNTGRITCQHERTFNPNPQIELCHGCLQMRSGLRSCTDCGVELCLECINGLRAGTGQPSGQ